ncbi:MAG: UMP kinase [Bacteroidales bacterium]|nr:UMP kinase [Bacteroidales bacterium]
MNMYSKILLKLSGESLGGDSGKGMDKNVLEEYAKQIVSAVKNGTSVSVVIGGGNIFRGLSGTGVGFDRVRGDQMGMLATVINSIALSMAIRTKGLECEVFTATPMEPFARYYVRDKALELMARGGVAIVAGGTGNPFFTTDSASALRAAELGVSALLKGTRVDGVYDSDPEKNPHAVKFESLTFDNALEQNLKIMDQTAFALCKENSIPIVVFDMNTSGNLEKLLRGEPVGTVVSNN